MNDVSDFKTLQCDASDSSTVHERVVLSGKGEPFTQVASPEASHSDGYSPNSSTHPPGKKGKPFLKWAGGKTSLLPHLLKRVPSQFRRYHEPFLGGGALFFALSPRLATLSDSNEELVNCYGVLRRHLDELLADLSRHKYEESYYKQIRNCDRLETYKYWSPVQRASRLIYLNKTCFNGLYRLNSKGQFNVPFGRYTNPTFRDETRLTDCSERLENARIQKADFLESTDQVDSDDFIYLDPPYIPLSKTSSFSSYTKDGFTIDHHRLLAEQCQKLHAKGVRFLLSNSDTPVTRELYRNFKIDTVLAPRSINTKASKRGKLAEVLVRNY